jgi:hypothetical protein
MQVASNLQKAGIDGAEGCQSLEELAVSCSVADLCSSESANHLYFAYGGGTQILEETRPLLDKVVTLCRRHRELKILIDAHVGVGAPSGIATSTSARRCESVTQELVELGVRAGKVTKTAWGKRISSVWDEPEDDTAARAEVFFRIGSKEFPKRRDYYDLVPENRRPTQQAETGELSSDDSEDDEGNPQHRIRGREMRHLLQILGIHGSSGIRFVRQFDPSGEFGDSSSDEHSHGEDEDVEEELDLTPLLAEEDVEEPS